MARRRIGPEGLRSLEARGVIHLYWDATPRAAMRLPEPRTTEQPLYRVILRAAGEPESAAQCYHTYSTWYTFTNLDYSQGSPRHYVVRVEVDQVSTLRYPGDATESGNGVRGLRTIVESYVGREGEPPDGPPGGTSSDQLLPQDEPGGAAAHVLTPWCLRDPPTGWSDNPFVVYIDPDSDADGSDKIDKLISDAIGLRNAAAQGRGPIVILRTGTYTNSSGGTIQKVIASPRRPAIITSAAMSGTAHFLRSADDPESEPGGYFSYRDASRNAVFGSIESLASGLECQLCGFLILEGFVFVNNGKNTYAYSRDIVARNIVRDVPYALVADTGPRKEPGDRGFRASGFNLLLENVMATDSRMQSWGLGGPGTSAKLAQGAVEGLDALRLRRRYSHAVYVESPPVTEPSLARGETGMEGLLGSRSDERLAYPLTCDEADDAVNYVYYGNGRPVSETHCVVISHSMFRFSGQNAVHLNCAGQADMSNIVVECCAIGNESQSGVGILGPHQDMHIRNNIFFSIERAAIFIVVELREGGGSSGNDYYTGRREAEFPSDSTFVTSDPYVVERSGGSRRVRCSSVSGGESVGIGQLDDFRNINVYQNTASTPFLLCQVETFDRYLLDGLVLVNNIAYNVQPRPVSNFKFPLVFWNDYYWVRNLTGDPVLLGTLKLKQVAVGLGKKKRKKSSRVSVRYTFRGVSRAVNVLHNVLWSRVSAVISSPAPGIKDPRRLERASIASGEGKKLKFQRWRAPGRRNANKSEVPDEEEILLESGAAAEVEVGVPKLHAWAKSSAKQQLGYWAGNVYARAKADPRWTFAKGQRPISERAAVYAVYVPDVAIRSTRGSAFSAGLGQTGRGYPYDVHIRCTRDIFGDVRSFAAGADVACGAVVYEGPATANDVWPLQEEQ